MPSPTTRVAAFGASIHPPQRFSPRLRDKFERSQHNSTLLYPSHSSHRDVDRTRSHYTSPPSHYRSSTHHRQSHIHYDSTSPYNTVHHSPPQLPLPQHLQYAAHIPYTREPRTGGRQPTSQSTFHSSSTNKRHRSKSPPSRKSKMKVKSAIDDVSDN